MTDNVVITISCGTDNPNRATRAIHLATVAHKEGKNVTLFLLDEAVYLAKKGLLEHVRAATGDIADDLMTYLEAHEVDILVCTPCAKSRKITEEDLIDGARMGSAIERQACVKLSTDRSFAIQPASKWISAARRKSLFRNETSISATLRRVFKSSRPMIPKSTTAI